MIALFLALIAHTAPPSTGPVSLPVIEGSQAVPAEALHIGRVGGKPAIYVEVRMDGVAVDGEPVLVLREGSAPRAADGEAVLRPVFERAAERIGDRKRDGAGRPELGEDGDLPFVAVLAIDARVETGVLVRVSESLRHAGVEQLALLVDDSGARELWQAARPGGAARLQSPTFELVVVVSHDGFEVVETDVTLSARDQRGLTCTDSCGSVDKLPWDALERVLGVLGERYDAAMPVKVVTRERDLPVAALLGAVGRARTHFDVVVPGLLGDPLLGGTLEIDGKAEPQALNGRLEVISVVLPAVSEAQRLTGVPRHEVDARFVEVDGRLQACLAQGGADTEIGVRFEVDAKGKVSAATISRSTVDEPSPGQCVLRIVRELEFEPPYGEPPFVVTRTLTRGS